MVFSLAWYTSSEFSLTWALAYLNMLLASALLKVSFVRVFKTTSLLFKQVVLSCNKNLKPQNRMSIHSLSGLSHRL